MVWKFRNTGLLFVLAAIVSILLANVQVYAQVSGATLSGTVTDPSGGVIPNATLSIKNVATGIERQTTADASGVYTAPNLLPGTYEVTVTAAGFATSVQSGITLTVGAQQLLNFSMKVGDSSQKVEVTGEALSVQLASSEISGVVTDRTVQELPLNGRDWTSLATLQPGVDSLGTDQANTGTKDRARRGYGVEMTISGSRPSQNNYRIDGINVNDYANGGPGSVEGATLGVDAIQEFSVLTSNYSAEYGRTSGGVINAITKSGTNNYHGSAYEFLRNGALDAANFFDNATGSPKPHFERNQFGGGVGGPIAKDNTFFYADYEGLRSNQGTTTIANVPSAAIRGIGTGPGGGPGPSMVCSISQSASGGCSPQTLANYLASTGQPAVANPDPVTGIDKSVLPFLGLWQLPNQPLTGNGDQGNYAFDSVNLTTENFGTIRIDHKFSDKDSLFGTYQNDQAISTQPDPNNNVLVQNATGRQFVDVEETHIFSPTLLNTARFGLNRSVHTGGGLSAINPLSSNLALGESAGADNPQIDVPALTSIQPGLNQVEIVDFYQNSFQGYDDVFWTRGKHSVKFGFSVENIQTTAYNPAPVGEFPFNSLYDSNNNGFLTNNPSVLFAPVPSAPFVHFQFHTTIVGGYVQDDIRVRPTLTLNLGMRYEMSTVPNEINGDLSALSSPIGQSLATANIGHTIFSNPTLHNFEPRVGFAWDPFGNGKTSVRGGFGMFDVLPLNYQLGQFATNAAPFTENAAVSTSTSTNVCGASGTSSCALTQGDFPVLAFNKLAQSASQGLSLRIPYVEPNPKRNYVMQWNLAIQRELASNLTAMIAYVGSRGVHMEFRADDINTTQPLLTPAGYLFPGSTNGVSNGTTLSPLIGQMDTLQWGNDSFFQGMEAQVNKRMSHGFEVGASYTWSRAIDGSDGAIASDSFLNSIPSLLYFLPYYRRGPADFNITNNLTVNYLWNIPNPLHGHGFASKITGGWQAGGILTARSGLPFTPLIGGDPLGLGNTSPFAYPDKLGGPGCGTLTNPGNPNNYIKTQCFGLPKSTPAIAAQCIPFAPNGIVATGTCSNLLGTGGRNEITGPGMLDVDFSLVKETKINETLNLEFRAEAFNIINRANFNAPIDNSTLFNSDGSPNPLGGVIDSAGDPRQIQFGLKLIF